MSLQDQKAKKKGYKEPNKTQHLYVPMNHTKYHQQSNYKQEQ